MGVPALAAAWVASRQASPEAWLAVWWAGAVFAVGIGGGATARPGPAGRGPRPSGACWAVWGLGVWWAEALFAIGIGGWTTARKARAAKMPLLSGPGRKFALSLAPPLPAGALRPPFPHDSPLRRPRPGA